MRLRVFLSGCLWMMLGLRLGLMLGLAWLVSRGNVSICFRPGYAHSAGEKISLKSTLFLNKLSPLNVYSLGDGK